VITLPADAWGCFLLPNSQTVSEAHSAPYSMGIKSSFPVLKRPESKANHWTELSPEVKNTWFYTSTHPDAFVT